MISRIVSLAFLAWASAATIAHAQNPPAGADFCAAAPNELLLALDGSWTLTQGVTQAGMLTLPPPPPVAVTFSYDPEQRAVNVVAADLSDDMIMFVASELQQGPTASMIEQEAAQPSVCNWYELPTLIGTNLYLYHGTSELYSVSRAVCEATNLYYRNSIPDVEGDRPSVESLCGYDDAGNRMQSTRSGSMELTMVLRFTSPNNGSGRVHFDGRQGGRPFSGYASVTLSRN
jgi:hypothetical protein